MIEQENIQETIEVKNYTIHLISKTRNEDAEIDLSNSNLVVDEFSEKLLLELHKSISESTVLRNTKFKVESTNTFSTRLDAYLESEEDASVFYDFSLSIEELYETIRKIGFATGGYYVFADYSIRGKRFITVALLRKKNGLNIVKEGNQFRLLGAENLSIDKIAMAFRLNYLIYTNAEQNEEEKDNYLVLIATKNDGEVSGYFRNWVNSGELIKNAQNTRSLVDIIENIPLPDGDDFENRYDFQNAIFDYAKSNKNRLINVYDLSSHLYGVEKRTYIMDFAKEHNIILDPEFKKEASVWRRLITIKAKIDGIELNIKHEKINGDDVKIDVDTIIIRSRELVKKINDQRIAKN